MLPSKHLQSVKAVCPFVEEESGRKFVQTMKAESRNGQRKKEQYPYGCQCKAKALVYWHLGESIRIRPRRWKLGHSLFWVLT